MERPFVVSALEQQVKARPLPRHVGIIMDGNGRWAEIRGLPRLEGHREGSVSVREVTRTARRVGVSALTLYAFSSQNWARPADEVAGLMELLREFLVSEYSEILDNGIRLNAIAPGEIPTEGMSKRLMPGAEPGASAARNPMGRVGRIEELQNLATFLMSDGCDWLSGETIVMDGADALATGGNFYELRRWGDAEWKAAREAIQAINARDKAERS